MGNNLFAQVLGFNMMLIIKMLSDRMEECQNVGYSCQLCSSYCEFILVLVLVILRNSCSYQDNLG